MSKVAEIGKQIKELLYIRDSITLGAWNPSDSNIRELEELGVDMKGFMASIVIDEQTSLNPVQEIAKATPIETTSSIDQEPQTIAHNNVLVPIAKKKTKAKRKSKIKQFFKKAA